MKLPLPVAAQKALLLILALVAISMVVILYMIIDVSISSRPHRIESIADIPAKRVAMVFGANVYRSGELSPILRDRVEGGIELYEGGKVEKILMTGDNSTADYNEVSAMKAYAVERGVPEENIVLDYAGLNTYDSCYRARNIFGVTEAVVVTQRYHAPRAAYACRKVGIDAVAFALPDFERYPDLRFSYSVREYMADVKAWTALNVTKPEATIMGKTEPEI